MALDIDWAQAWREHSAERNKPDNEQFWDNRAPSFAKTAGTSPYAARFLELTGVREGESVFDMGCGSGTLALPLAREGHEIVACDFSQVMLDLMMQRAELDGIAGLISTHKLAWADDWSTHDLPVCDVAVASRSIATDDLQSALLKLESKARRRVCLTLSNGISPHLDSVLMGIVGRPAPVAPEYMYAMNLLWQMGRSPELQLIESGRPAVYDSPEHALEKNAELMEATPEERDLLAAYIAEHLVPMKTEEGEGWGFTHKRLAVWGFVSWNL